MAKLESVTVRREMSQARINEGHDARRDLCVDVRNGRLSCKLDGELAAISGVHNDFATVWTMSDTAGVQFSWEAVARVLRAGGNFKR